MKYVDNLLEVKPEEIRHINTDDPIQAIVRVRNPKTTEERVVVIWEGGVVMSLSTDGRDIAGKPLFVFRPKKVKKLKPLHVILAQDTNYYINQNGSIISCNDLWSILYYELRYFGKPVEPDMQWDESWIEEVEE
jgi:hypothetical protein